MLPSNAQYLQECPNAASPATFRTYDTDLVQNTTICMDFEGNLHSRELESEIGLTFDTDLQDPEIFCFENSDKDIIILIIINNKWNATNDAR